MPKRQTFYSFHYDKDVLRVQQIRNIGALEDNKPVASNQWEDVKRKGDAAVENWIDENMKMRSCVVVLIGEETSDRPWVKYEIKKAWKDGKGLFGIYIHNLNCPNNGKGKKGKNPFDQFTFKKGENIVVPMCYTPSIDKAYQDIAGNLENWVEAAIAQRK